MRAAARLPEQFLGSRDERRRLYIQRLRELEQSGKGRLADATLHLRYERAVHIRVQGKLFLRYAGSGALLTQDASERR